jgi:hypothetical protein
MIRERLAVWAGSLVGVVACERAPAEQAELIARPAALTEQPQPTEPEPSDSYNPLAHARAELGKLDNLEAPVPPQCYTKAESRANPCWMCHTRSSWPNAQSDWDLQGSYAFSDVGKTNYWTNLFEDRRAAISSISDAEIREWIAADNYTPLRDTLAAWPRDDYRGFRPDLDFAAGFDEQGFARDGSQWRAFRYKPFPGAFWPTNGSADDVMIRLPIAYRSDADGRPSLEIYKANLAILEASMAANPKLPDAALRWPIEAIQESAAGLDLDGDGQIEGAATWLVGLPAHFAGAAADRVVRRGLYPEGTEFLHSVRYLDPAGGSATRMKELRYSVRFADLSDLAIQRAYDREAEEKAEGGLPYFGGSPLTGLRNDFGWQLQGFIEDARGRLRVQTEEETYFCMGCHSNLGVTADQSFAFPRKLPGAAGWAYQDIRGIPDAPLLGHVNGEIATWLARAEAGDEFRSNPEMLARWFSPDGTIDEAALANAADIVALIVPSPERALLLDKAYLVIVREQSFDRGRDPVVEPLANVHRKIEVETSGLSEAGRVYLDGGLRLAWPELASR